MPVQADTVDPTGAADDTHVRPANNRETLVLLERLKQGDRSALEGLLARHRDQLRRMIQLRLDARLRQRLDASDIIQEAQLEIAQRIDDYLAREPMPFHVWLRKTAYQNLLRLRREHVETAKRGVGQEAPFPERSSILLIQRLGQGMGMPLDQLLQDELRLRIQQAIQELSEIDREILLLRTVEGLSNQECAQVLDIESSAANKRFGRALLRLRQVLVDQQIVGSAVVSPDIPH